MNSFIDKIKTSGTKSFNYYISYDRKYVYMSLKCVENLLTTDIMQQLQTIGNVNVHLCYALDQIWEKLKQICELKIKKIYYGHYLPSNDKKRIKLEITLFNNIYINIWSVLNDRYDSIASQCLTKLLQNNSCIKLELRGIVIPQLNISVKKLLCSYDAFVNLSNESRFENLYVSKEFALWISDNEEYFKLKSQLHNINTIFVHGNSYLKFLSTEKVCGLSLPFDGKIELHPNTKILRISNNIDNLIPIIDVHLIIKEMDKRTGEYNIIKQQHITNNKVIEIIWDDNFIQQNKERDDNILLSCQLEKYNPTLKMIKKYNFIKAFVSLRTLLED